MSEEQLGAPEEDVDGVGDNFKGVENVQSKGDVLELEVFAGGENESTIRKTSEEDIEVIRRRENKWLHMLDHWDKYMLEKYKKVRHRCRKGIPPSIRPRAWQHLCGAKYRMSRQPGTSPIHVCLFVTWVVRRAP